MRFTAHAPYPRVASSRCPMVRLLVISLFIAALLAGCAGAPVRTEGVAGPLTWKATDFELTKTTVNNQQTASYSFALFLKNTSGTGMTLTKMRGSVFQHGVSPASLEHTGQWRLGPDGELRAPFGFSWYCPEQFDGCGATAGTPQWKIILTGSDDRGQPVTAVIEIIAPPLPS